MEVFAQSVVLLFFIDIRIRQEKAAAKVLVSLPWLQQKKVGKSPFCSGDQYFLARSAISSNNQQHAELKETAIYI